MKWSRIAAATLACLPLGAIAADWVKVTAPDGNKHWYDRSKLLVEGEVITYWRLVEFRRPQASQAGLAITAMYRESIDCRAHTHRTLGYLLYGANRVVIENVHTPDSEPEPVIPETLGDRYDKVMCILAPQLRTEQTATTGAATPVPPTKEEILREIEFLEARLRVLREQLELRSETEVAPAIEPSPPPATEAR